MVKRISVMSAWSDDNKGDAGILIGLINLIQQTVTDDDLNIDLISHFSSDDPDFEYHHRFVRQHLDQRVTMRSALMPRRPDKVGDRRAHRFELMKAVLISVFVLMLAPVLKRSRWFPFLSSSEHRTLVAMSQSDLVIYKGGHEFYTRKGIGAFIAFYIPMFPLLLALRLKRRVVIYGQSIGPVEGRAPRWLLRYLLNRCEYVLVRESQSHQLVLNELGAEFHDRCSVTWDTGFLMQAENLPHDIEVSLPTQFVACTLRPWNFPNTPGESGSKYEHYLAAMSSLIIRIKQELGLSVVLVPQVTGPSAQVSDYSAWDDLIGKLNDAHRPVEIRSDLSPGELITIYQKAELVIGTRFHSIIFAIVANTPGLAISYHGFKTTGIMSMLGLLDYVIEIDGIDAERMWEQLQQLLGERASISDRLAAHMARIQQESLNTAQTILAFDEAQNR